MGSRILSCLLRGFFILQILISPCLSFAEGPTLYEVFQNELNSPQEELPSALRQELSKKHFVFVDGIMNELANITGNYFYDNINELKKQGFSTEHLRLSSATSIPENGTKLAKSLSEIQKRVGRPLIVIAHSMGGAEALYSVLISPQLLADNIVEKLILIQPAIGGSPMAESLKINYLGASIRVLLGDGLKSLIPRNAQRNFHLVYSFFKTYFKMRFKAAGMEGAFKKFTLSSNKVSYIRTYVTPKTDLSWGIQIVQSFCSNTSVGAGVGDGLLNEKDQILNFLPQFGVDRGLFEADHIELVVAGVFSRSTQFKRQAFTRALLKKEYEYLLN